MPYPIDFHATRKQPGAGGSTDRDSQSRWGNVPSFSFDANNNKEPTPEHGGSESSFATRSKDFRAPLPPPASKTAPEERALTLEEKERERNYRLVTAHRNITRMSQYILKLEVRANIATKEDVRQTLETTLENIQYSSRDNMTSEDPGQNGKLLEDLVRVSDQTWNRLYLVDQSFTRISRQNRTDDGCSGPIPLRGESYTKAWLDSVIASNSLMDEGTIFYTIQDLASGRPLSLWLTYIRETLFQFGDGSPARDDRVLSIAWSFLDRAIRPSSRPGPTTTVAQFVAEWEAMRKSGAFDSARLDPESQRESDAKLLTSIKGIWSARARPL
ncbi:hypothetical protein PGQ11_000211 [Apiospora arundinis]